MHMGGEKVRLGPSSLYGPCFSLIYQRLTHKFETEREIQTLVNLDVLKMDRACGYRQTDNCAFFRG